MKAIKRKLAFLMTLCLLWTAVGGTAFAENILNFGPTGEEFYVSKVSANDYGIVGEKKISFSLRIKGGTTPYYADYTISVGGEVLESKHIFCTEDVYISYMPDRYGDHKFNILVTDADHRQLSGSAKVPVSNQPRYESQGNWEYTLRDVQLTGDMKNDVIAIARTQLGYRPDQTAFVLDGYGRHFYTRYGEWYGAPYAEWCVMFISFCLYYANVPASVIPKNSGCVPLMDYFKQSGAYHEASSGYVPGKADIIFMDYAGKGVPTHAGIVTSASDDSVCTVEGNTSQGVAEKTYTVGDPQVMGYGSFQTVLSNAGL